MHTHTQTLENMTNNNTYRRAMKEIFGIVIGGEKKTKNPLICDSMENGNV